MSNKSLGADEAILDSTGPVVNEIIEELFLNEPKYPFDYVYSILENTKRCLSIDDIARELSATSYRSPLFLLKSQRAYDGLCRLSRKWKPSVSSGEMLLNLLRSLLKNVSGLEQLLSHFNLKKSSHISFLRFTAILTASLAFREFSGLCGKLFHSDAVSHINLLRYIERLADKDTSLEIPDGQSLSGEETKSDNLSFDDFMNKITELFISQMHIPA
ncbi:unnamed protein product [Calicophoron daubneyi]|uniref:Uncharacterized protein n=1 Tax=Calicophoron daubneyi TaxID=300641 RepID=A0AAV2U0S7_CALDB